MHGPDHDELRSLLNRLVGQAKVSKMKLISVNVGQPRVVQWMRRPATTGIFKEPVAGRVALGRLNLNGDEQADLSVHGGVEKAVYVYPAEYYTYWQKELPGIQLPWGSFGENFTTEGLLDEDVNIGDRFRIGSAEVMVTQPRLPCYKLAIRFGRNDIIKQFMASGRPGFYLSVSQEGEVGAGDLIYRMSRDDNQVTVSDIFRLMGSDRDDVKTMRRAVQTQALPQDWRRHFLLRLE